jgi:hypothetical protein
MIRLRRRPVDPRRRRRRRWTALAVALLLAIPVTSYVRALTYPGNATFSVRSVEWVRDHGGGGIINTIENWRYSRQAPPAVGMPQDQVRDPVGSLPPPAARRAGLPQVALVPDVKSLAGEGHWTAERRTGRAVLWTTWFRPDPRHLPVIVAAALIPRTVDAIHLMPGTREPVVGMSSPVGYSVPDSALSDLVATFNSGFRMRDAKGGWWTTWGHAVPLVDGRASIVIYADGSARIGAWNRDVAMTPRVVAVRQNLDMVIANGRIADGLATNFDGRWGSARSQFQYTWRSGIGTDAHGNLVYVAGHGMTLATFARAMRDAGVVQGMELDIHPAMVNFSIHRPGRDGAVISHRLLDSMGSPADRYLSADQRDFFYVTAKP